MEEPIKNYANYMHRAGQSEQFRFDNSLDEDSSRTKRALQLALVVVALGIVIANLLSCSDEAKAGRTISHEAFDEFIEMQHPQIIDVRSEKEFLLGHLPDAQNIDIEIPDFLGRAQKAISKDRPVALYCLRGDRSKIALNILLDKGYDAYDLKGGLVEWSEARLQK